MFTAPPPSRLPSLCCSFPFFLLEAAGRTPVSVCLAMRDGRHCPLLRFGVDEEPVREGVWRGLSEAHRLRGTFTQQPLCIVT